MVYNYKSKKINMDDNLVRIYEETVYDKICSRTLGLYMDVLKLDDEGLDNISDKKLSAEITRLMKEEIKVMGGEC